MNSYTNSAFLTYFVTSVIAWAAYTPPAVYVIYKSKFQIDSAFRVNIITNLVSFAIKVIIWLIIWLTQTSSDLQYLILVTRIIDLITNWAIELNIYYVVFEMWKVQNLLTSNTRESQIYRKQKIMQNQQGVMLLCTVIMIISAIFYILRYTVNFNAGLFNPYEIVYQIVKFIRFLIALWVMVIFAKSMSYFIQNKKQTLKHQRKSYTICNYLIILWIVILFLENLVNQLIKGFI